MQTSFTLNKEDIEKVKKFANEIRDNNAQSNYDFGDYRIARNYTDFSADTIEGKLS